jgi:c(7)-type cytochrome triheme protein
VKILPKKICQTGVIVICTLCVLAFGLAYAQKKVGGGDIQFEAKGSSGPVTFRHEFHATTQKLKCTDCHTKIFKMKKEDLKMPKAEHGTNKACGVCHNGTKAFSQTSEADCAKCHKK